MALGATASSTASVLAGPAIGQFEIKSLEAVPGRIELQSQNALAFGNPRRAAMADDGDIEADDNSVASVRAALEVEYVFSRYFKTRIGIEYEKERRDEVSSLGAAEDFDSIRLDEYGIEAIVVLVPRPRQGFALGLFAEYEHAAHAGEARKLNYGPIIEWISGPWLATFNPSLVSFLGGERNEAGKLDFAYTARIMHRTTDNIALALEAYGTVERIGSSGSPGDEARLFGDFDQHRIGPVVYWSFEADEADGVPGETEMTVGIGAFAGLNENTPDATLKLSLEVEF